MIYICSKQLKVDKLWGIFIKHLIELRESGVSVKYVRKGEVILDGKRYKPVYMENTMRWEPIGWEYQDRYITFTGHDIKPLILFLRMEKEKESPSISAKYNMTPVDLVMAYRKQQDIYDRQNIVENLSWIVEAADISDDYTARELAENKEFIRRAAGYSREYQDSENQRFTDSMVNAVKKVEEEMRTEGLLGERSKSEKE